MHRLLFQKVGDGVYLSHLDLIRVFQRAFKRGGVMLKHSQGFAPKPYVSVALALSVGVQSVCEIMDFELENDIPVPADLKERLNATLPAGIRVLEVYDSDRKTKELTHLNAKLVLEYDNGTPADAKSAIEELLNRDEVIVKKFSKKGETETNIIPMILQFSVAEVSAQELTLDVTVCAQNPTLNPMLIISAIETYLPKYAPNFAFCRREEVLDNLGNPFR